MPQQKRVLLISCEFPPNTGGIGNHAYNLAASLSREEYKVTVLTDTIGIEKSALQSFSAGQSFRIKWIIRKKVVAITYVERIFKAILLSLKADVVICSGKYPLWMINLIKLSGRKKAVAVVHGSELDIKSFLPNKLTRLSVAKFDSIVSVSEYTQSHLPSKAFASLSRTKVIHNGVDNEEFGEVSRMELKGNPALITIGSVTPRKGQRNVIKALPAIIRDFPSVFYHIIGKPVIQGDLQKLAGTLKVHDKVEFYGAVSRKKLIEMVSGATIKMMLSNHTSEGDFEGFGIAILEANALGIPAIGSKDSGIADAIVNYKTGILVDPDNDTEVAAAVRHIMENYQLYSHNAKEWAMQHDWRFIVKQYISLFD